MLLFGWALLGAVLGAVGTEVLRETKPELVEKVEDAARRLVGSLCSSESEEQAESALEATAAQPDEGSGVEERESEQPVAQAEPPVLPDTSAVPEPGNE